MNVYVKKGILYTDQVRTVITAKPLAVVEQIKCSWCGALNKCARVSQKTFDSLRDLNYLNSDLPILIVDEGGAGPITYECFSCKIAKISKNAWPVDEPLPTWPHLDR